MRRPAPQSGPPLEELRPGQGDDEDRVAARPLEEVVDEVEQPAVGPVEVLEDEHGRCPVGEIRSKNVRQAANSSSRPPGGASPTPSSDSERRLDPAPLGLVGHVLGERRGDPLAWSSLVVGLGEPRAPADHLAERPERDALAVRRASGPGASRPSSTRPSMYLRNSQASRLLPMPAWPVTETSRARRSRAVAWRQSLSRRSSSSRPTNGASSPRDRPGPPRSATTRSARHAGDRRGLALEELLAGRLEGDRARAAARFVASPTSTVPGGATDWRRLAVLTRSPATIPWSVGAEGDGGLAGQDAGPQLEARRRRLACPSWRDRVDEVEGRPDGALGVVLVGDRRAPDGHDRVADELLDGAAVALDDLAARSRSSGPGTRGPPPGRCPRSAP